MTDKDKEKLHQILSSLRKNDNSVGKMCYNQALQDAQIAIDSLQEEPKFKLGDIVRRKSDGLQARVINIVDGTYIVECEDWNDSILEHQWELVEEPAGLDKGKLIFMLEDSLSKETKDSWNERLDKDEEPVSEDLEEAAEEWDESLYRSDAFKAGAKWQKAQFEEGGGWYYRYTYDIICRWLRETHGLHIYTFRLVNSWHYEIQVFKEEYTTSKGGYNSHDEACEAAIWYCVNNLI